MSSLAFLERIDKLQEEISGKRKQIVADARVVACTAYKPLIDKEIIELEFDVVVIDEASMIPLSLFYCSAAKAKSRLVIAGDFRQLPPIVQVGTKLKKENFKVSASDTEYKELLTKNPFTYSKVIDGIGQEYDTRQQGTVYPMSGLGDVTYREQKQFKKFRKEAIDSPAADMGVGGTLGGSSNKEPLVTPLDKYGMAGITIKKKKK